MLTEGLEDYFQVTAADSGIDALDIVKQEGRHFDVMVLDINMPIMDGFELCERIGAFYAGCKLGAMMLITEIEQPKRAGTQSINSPVLEPELGEGLGASQSHGPILKQAKKESRSSTKGARARTLPLIYALTMDINEGMKRRMQNTLFFKAFGDMKTKEMLEILEDLKQRERGLQPEPDASSSDSAQQQESDQA